MTKVVKLVAVTPEMEKMIRLAIRARHRPTRCINTRLVVVLCWCCAGAAGTAAELVVCTSH